MCVHACLQMLINHLWRPAPSDFLELNSQVALNPLSWVPRGRLRPSARVVHALHCRASLWPRAGPFLTSISYELIPFVPSSVLRINFKILFDINEILFPQFLFLEILSVLYFGEVFCLFIRLVLLMYKNASQIAKGTCLAYGICPASIYSPALHFLIFLSMRLPSCDFPLSLCLCVSPSCVLECALSLPLSLSLFLSLSSPSLILPPSTSSVCVLC